MSMRKALEILGIGKCYHMHEVFLNPSHISFWESVIQGLQPDWHQLLEGYSATLDVPACLYWKELMNVFPAASVILLWRNPEIWYESMRSTTYPLVMKNHDNPALKMIRQVFFDDFMDGRFENRDHAIGVFRRYCQQVEDTVPKNKLLKYDITQGWDPLCRFLDCELPAESFPFKNTRQDFIERNQD